MTVRITIVSALLVSNFPRALLCYFHNYIFKKQNKTVGFVVVVLKPHALPEAPNSMHQTGEAAAFPPALGARKASPPDAVVRCPFQCQMVLPVIPGKWKGNDRVTFSLANFVCLFHLVWFSGDVFVFCLV